MIGPSLIGNIYKKMLLNYVITGITLKSSLDNWVLLTKSNNFILLSETLVEYTET